MDFPKVDMNIVTPCDMFMEEFLKLFREEYGDTYTYFRSNGDVLFVVYTERVKVDEQGVETEVTRIISARYATNFERGIYYGKF